MISGITVFIGIATFLVGFFFLGKSIGEKQCSVEPTDTSRNYIGGVSGSVIGGVVILIGLYLGYRQNKINLSKL